MILLPAEGDNAAIATRRLEPGEIFELNGAAITLRQTIPEGHRVAARALAAGELILSWGLPFARTLRAVAPGEYLCNAKILSALRQRNIGFEIPAEANFENHRLHFELDEARFQPGAQIPLHPMSGTFLGFPRSHGRGAGTRNFVVVLATSSRANSVARAVADSFKSYRHPNVDGIVAVAHTEGGGAARPNNFELVVATVNGFLRNPNVAAFVAIDEGDEPVNTRCLNVVGPPGEFVSIRGDFEAAIAQARAAVARLLPAAERCDRVSVPLSNLKIGLQCGGSDAFSGVSANPLVGWIARETIRHGGAASLAETDELIGAESYVLANVCDVDTARAFLEKIARFQERAAWHGHSAEGNPSGGNMLRGLYNITVKSIGAALKKSADTRLDYVIDYGGPMERPGFYFMDSPGNDLESIAGQVASGCNMILFATGNGSITNFPFVPTIKVMTTTRRFELLAREMDFNAGRYLDGESMDALGAEAFGLTVRVASGEKSAGEKAGHAQTQIWREWRQTGPNARLDAPTLSGQPIPIIGETLDLSGQTFQGIRVGEGWATQRLNLIVPTSLCAGQIAALIASARELQPCVALPHTEGCGNSGGESERLMLRTLAGYATHPLAARALMLEHGCEKTHNDAFRSQLSPEQIAKLGWASIQLDGGIERVIAKAASWFKASGAAAPSSTREPAPVSALRVGILSAAGSLPEAFLLAARSLARAGALVVLPERDLGAPTIDYGQPAPSRGLHSMRAPTDHFVEIATGLGATGVELIIACQADGPVQGHPFVPVFPISTISSENKIAARQIIHLILRAASGDLKPERHADFQITRGLEGVSL
jgi:altronate dehydratase